jgi:N-acyl-D-amino-acid deacylase
MKFAALLTFIPALALAQPYDILIRHGRIVDGAGNPSFIGDVAILNGRIAAMGNLPGATAQRVIDAAGMVVAPGCIDIHNHSDYTVVADGDAQSMIRQGVTSMIFGEGGSAAPADGKQGWTDFRGYFALLMKQGISTNIGSYVVPARSGPTCTASAPDRPPPPNSAGWKRWSSRPWNRARWVWPVH